VVGVVLVEVATTKEVERLARLSPANRLSRPAAALQPYAVERASSTVVADFVARTCDDRRPACEEFCIRESVFFCCFS
jgi:hypothetical protein